MRFIPWMLGFITASAVIVGLTWWMLITFESFASILFQFLYGEENMIILVAKVIGIGVFIGVEALLLQTIVRAIFSYSR